MGFTANREPSGLNASPPTGESSLNSATFVAMSEEECRPSKLLSDPDTAGVVPEMRAREAQIENARRLNILFSEGPIIYLQAPSSARRGLSRVMRITQFL